MRGWRLFRVEDLSAPEKYALNGGPFGSKLVSTDYASEGVPVIRGGDLTEDGSLSFRDFVFVSEQKADELLPNNAHPGDLVLTQRGTLGQVALIPRPCAYGRFVISQSQMKLTVDESKVNAYFLLCYFRSPATKVSITNLASSSGVPHINLDTLRRFPVTIPPLPIQQKVAAILSAYDDLIENNTRRIAILEEMAQALYREWFVNFRFPGHQDARVVESEIGPIPEGWEVRTLGEVSGIVMGQSPSSHFYNFAGEGLPFHQGVTDFGAHFPRDRVYCTVPNRIAKKGDILFSVRAPVGRINVATTRMVIGRGLCAIGAKSLPQTFILYQLKERFTEEDSMGGGTIFKAVTKDDMRGIKVLVPSDSIALAYHDIAQPMRREMEVLTGKNTNLRQTRDQLLPRLISGEIDVSELDIRTEEASA